MAEEGEAVDIGETVDTDIAFGAKLGRDDRSRVPFISFRSGSLTVVFEWSVGNGEAIADFISQGMAKAEQHIQELQQTNGSDSPDG